MKLDNPPPQIQVAIEAVSRKQHVLWIASDFARQKEVYDHVRKAYDSYIRDCDQSPWQSGAICFFSGLGRISFTNIKSGDARFCADVVIGDQLASPDKMTVVCALPYILDGSTNPSVYLG